MSKRRKIDETTEEAERVEWFVYNGGNIEPEKGVRYTHIRVEGTTRIDNAFWKCRNELLRVEICEGVKEIRRKAFYECQHLESVAFPSTLTSIGFLAFDGCKSLKRVELNEQGLESVGGEAFMNCTSLEFIYLPSTVTSIASYAFCGCKSLKSVVIPQSVTSISQSTFSGCTSLESIIIPPSVTSVGNLAFMGCEKLKEVTFQSPHQLRSIGHGAFQNCLALEEINIPATVTLIWWGSFESCQNLKKVDLRGGSPEVMISAFHNCPKFDHGNIIANGRVNIDTFRRFARADLSRRIGSMTDERQAMIETKLNAIPNQIVAGPSSDKGGIPQSMKDSLAKVHGLITFWDLKESTTIIELAVWRLSLDGEIDVKSRQRIRQQCGRDMYVIMSSVLQFFDYNTEE